MILEILVLLIGIFIFLLLCCFGWGIHIFNYLNSGKINLETQWSNVKTEYQRRLDLLPNLAEAVKSFKKHEAFTYPEIAKMRSNVNLVGSKAKAMQSMDMLSSFFSKLMVANERYPELKAALHGDLMKEVRITEDRINIARTDYNDVVREYNIIIRTFPSNVISHMFGFRNELPFEVVNTEANQAPKLNLA